MSEPRLTTKMPSSVKPRKRTGTNSHQAALGLPGAARPLPPTAQRLLDAARRLLVRSGYRSLSAEAIGREAGEHKSLINYHFGSKQGLVIALIDWLMSDTLRQTYRRLSGMPGEKGSAELVAGITMAMLDDPQSYRLFFDLLPRLLENPSMARQFAELYRAYRDQNTRALWAGRSGNVPEEVRDLAAMAVALTDGLAVQILTEPGSVDVPRVLNLWGSIIDQRLACIPSADQAAEGPCGE